LPLSERIVDENLGSFRHVPQPRKRRRSAAADAEVLESRSADFAEAHDNDAVGHDQHRSRSAAGESVANRPRAATRRGPRTRKASGPPRP
jgi:hypothetical protein